MFIKRKSILLAMAIAMSCSIATQAQSDTQEVTINFEGWVGDEKFVCGESYEKIGTAESTVTPTDFRFYVSNLAMIDESGQVIPIELEQDGKWQHKNVALLDFEDASGGCDNGTAETRTTVVGKLPAGNYEDRDLQFTLGVPKNLNHEDAAIASSPLNLTSMWWNWQGGYKFLRVDLKTAEAITNVGATDNGEGATSTQQPNTHPNHDGNHAPTKTSPQPSIFQNKQSSQGQASGHADTKDPDRQAGGHNMNHQSFSSNGYLIHLGSTGCQDSAQSNLFGCANPNRVQVSLEDFDPDRNVVIADLAELLYQSDLSKNAANTPNGCMSAPEDSDCAPIMENLGISAANSTQNFFFVE